MTAAIPGLLRELTPRVLGVLVRRFGEFDQCEDAVQEALLSAAQQWPSDGVPANPTGWLVTVASRRWTEMWRSETARRRRETNAAQLEPPAAPPAPAEDDTLTLLLLCCHPALTPVSQVALTLRAVGGLTTAEIARALLVPEATVGQRISRAKQRLKGTQFTLQPAAELADRMVAVRHVLYLIFNEGYTASSGPTLQRVQLSVEAIRLTRQLHALRPHDGEVAGLLALMLLTDARRPARTDSDGALIPLAEQDRTRWDRAAINEGTALVTRALATAEPGPFQLQAAIAAVHDEAATAAETDWPQILVLYDLLHHVAPGPMVTLGRIVALSMVDGLRAGLRALDTAAGEPVLAGHHRLHAVRAHLLDLTGDAAGARAEYELAARRTLSIPERAYLESRAHRRSS
ncbi:RNA polymerase sigma factor [Micromonospora globispora]|uniref:RNA polymerase sigma factor n=1 Tax=Micromonospora globispora TaxID=1450148 RepID=UPI001A9C588C|nr:sigma-70 family RNA polymerase sigma factor [Micromonospora globispora]